MSLLSNLHSHETVWNMSIFMSFSLLCFSCSDHSNLKRMEFVNNASFMVFIVFLMEKKMSKRKEVYVYDDTKKKRDNRPECHALSCFYSHHRVENKQTTNKKKCVCPLSHIHIVVEFWSLAGGRTCLCSLCMAQTGASQPSQIPRGWKETWKEEEEEEDLDWLSNTKC